MKIYLIVNWHIKIYHLFISYLQLHKYFSENWNVWWPLLTFAESAEPRLTFGTLELVALIAGPVVLVSVFFVICFLSYRQCQQQGICMAPSSLTDGETQPFMQPGQTTDTLREMIMEYSGSGSGMYVSGVSDYLN